MASMPRQKYQRPKVYATGTREKLWKLEYREYFTDQDGKEHSRHKSRTWSRANFTKAEAQAAADAMLRELHAGGPKPDGNMTVKAFWDEIYFPSRSQTWTWNTANSARYIWTKHIEPEFGRCKIKDVTKYEIELHLAKLARKGLGEGVVRLVRMRLRSIFTEAVENDFIGKNPARKTKIPICKSPKGPRSLTAEEVRRLWDRTDGMDYLIWRILLLTGIRIGELIALTRQDVVSDGLIIDQNASNGQLGPTKNKKERTAPLSESLRAELEEWASHVDGDLLFASKRGLVLRRNNQQIEGVLERGAAIIPGLTFRQCRTTFSTLFDGELTDARDILGHHSVEFTLRVYRKSVLERKQVAVEKLDRTLKVVGKKA